MLHYGSGGELESRCVFELHGRSGKLYLRRGEGPCWSEGRIASDGLSCGQPCGKEGSQGIHRMILRSVHGRFATFKEGDLGTRQTNRWVLEYFLECSRFG